MNSKMHIFMDFCAPPNHRPNSIILHTVPLVFKNTLSCNGADQEKIDFCLLYLANWFRCTFERVNTVDLQNNMCMRGGAGRSSGLCSG